MNFDSLIPVTTSVGGGFFFGMVLGYFVKKIVKILMFVAGGIVGLLLYLQQQVILVDLDKMEASSAFIFNSVASSFDKVTQTGDMATLGIPLAGGLSAGLAIGLMKG